jgi:hypothetical protein
MDHNHAIIEVKSSQAVIAGIVKDLATLDQFRVNVGYARAIYLFYGGVDEQVVRELAGARPVTAPVELWVHPEHGVEAQLIAVLGAN